ncbi:1,2-phenylacetyl-CoA epoxidase subunit PaaE [Oceanicella actignis]|uniref:Ring-1,2-phenylacetyl-CoA epoxidase subunit PaaE n=1 Tax=Oceanicella actignis TaxID=1189325 RepID=A0A1M7SWX2_9RHOB|nr:1,2-phenylacetyl-CoA epoxidase subunit PaaE [Oceanicella actignis]TYO90564.1 ring-1,2-phenylacetyl-CoA epoxidase subunit PaaE [Oceanicella actignis]SES74508.1 ring-1,2-phenylacetyl-CoA epoxidase subunit PaaE [Oceanicella actignis]SHN63013.1 ring-1,2-phenylacetyl-CoA epoxidase subunit PaaE [Oceanicella actignis]
MAHGFHELTVREVRPEAPDAVSVLFDVPEALRPAFAFRPGQHLTLRATIDGQDLRRAYSICSTPEGGLRVGVRKLEGGRFSTFVCERLRPGDRIQVMPPDGRFGVDPGGRHDYLLLAAGSGVTPILSICRAVLENEPESRVTMIYGNRATETIMFREELEDLKDRFIDRFELIHVLSRESQDVELLHGRIDAERLRRMARAGLIDPARHDAAFICGPGEMIETAAGALREMGMPEERIHFERFTPAEDAAPRPVSDAAARAAEQGAVIEAVLDGARKSFRVTRPGQTVLEAAQASGLEIPYSCAGGMCCTCRCKVVEGESEMAVNYSLEPWEVEAGYTLACQTRPRSERLVLDFDAV